MAERNDSVGSDGGVATKAATAGAPEQRVQNVGLWDLRIRAVQLLLALAVAVVPIATFASNWLYARVQAWSQRVDCGRAVIYAGTICPLNKGTTQSQMTAGRVFVETESNGPAVVSCESAPLEGLTLEAKPIDVCVRKLMALPADAPEDEKNDAWVPLDLRDKKGLRITISSTRHNVLVDENRQWDYHIVISQKGITSVSAGSLRVQRWVAFNSTGTDTWPMHGK